MPAYLDESYRSDPGVYVTELGRAGVEEVVIERGDTATDLADEQVVLDAVGAGAVPRSLGYRHGAPELEPLLWIADVLAGATSEDLAQGSTRYRDLLGPRVVVWEVPEP